MLAIIISKQGTVRQNQTLRVEKPGIQLRTLANCLGTVIKIERGEHEKVL
jgi:hypothetical protein